jgi:hypothetical protein
MRRLGVVQARTVITSLASALSGTAAISIPAVGTVGGSFPLVRDELLVRRASAAVGELATVAAAVSSSTRTFSGPRNGQVTGFVRALERLAVRDTSARFLSQDKRIEIG